MTLEWTLLWRGGAGRGGAEWGDNFREKKVTYRCFPGRRQQGPLCRCLEGVLYRLRMSESEDIPFSLHAGYDRERRASTGLRYGEAR